jgi:hypothetical protein
LSWLLVAGLVAGAVLIPSASPALATQGEDHKVNVCHATSSDSNPYELIGVDIASTAGQGHLEHRNDPNKAWKSDGTYNGVAHVDGQAKPDLIEGLDAGVPPYPADGKDAEAMCGWVRGTPSEEPSEQPSEEPSEQPSEEPSEQPSESPSEEPSEQPSEEPSEQPSESPSEEPSEQPSEEPSESPSEEPSESPSEEPSEEPSESPSEEPSESPTGTVEAETGTPATTLPPTDTLANGGPTSGTNLQIVLLGMAGLLTLVLLVTPAGAVKRGKR